MKVLVVPWNIKVLCYILTLEPIVCKQGFKPCQIQQNGFSKKPIRYSVAGIPIKGFLKYLYKGILEKVFLTKPKRVPVFGHEENPFCTF